MRKKKAEDKGITFAELMQRRAAEHAKTKRPDPGLQTPEGFKRKIREDLEDAETEAHHKIRLMELLAKVNGWDGEGGAGDLERMTNEELFELVEDVVLPALKPYGVKVIKDGELVGCWQCGNPAIYNRKTMLCLDCTDRMAAQARVVEESNA